MNSKLKWDIDQWLQEKYLTRLHDSKMLELLVTIASSSSHPDFAEWNIIAMQIIFYLLKGCDPTAIAEGGGKDVRKSYGSST